MLRLRIISQIRHAINPSITISGFSSSAHRYKAKSGINIAYLQSILIGIA